MLWIVRFQVLTVVNVKIVDFWIVAPCCLVEVYRRFRGACCLRHLGDDRPASKHLWNVGKILPEYTAQQPRSQPSSCYEYLHRFYDRVSAEVKVLDSYDKFRYSNLKEPTTTSILFLTFSPCMIISPSHTSVGLCNLRSWQTFVKS
jgi:hypothetical protein